MAPNIRVNSFSDEPRKAALRDAVVRYDTLHIASDTFRDDYVESGRRCKCPGGSRLAGSDTCKARLRRYPAQTR